jgi:nucleoid-associated protein YgaU
MVYGAARQREIERAMRAHPAGRALRARAGACPPGGAEGDVREGCVAPARPALRLTARGRRLALSLAVAGGVGLAALLHGVLAGDGAGGLHLAGETSVVVRPGDTLWSIASSVAGEGDVRVVVQEIREVNGLHGSGIVPGEVLRLP